MDARTDRAGLSNAGFSNAKYDAAFAINFVSPRQTAPSNGRTVTFAARALIVDEGDVASNVYEVSEGSVILFKLLPDGRRQIIEVLGAGDVFGLTPTGIADVAAEALTAVRLLVYDQRAIEREEGLRDRLFARLRAQMCALHDHALLLGRKSAQERVATFIMRLVPGRGGVACPGPGKAGPDSRRVGLAMTRQEIADYLGLTIETVSRAFSALRRDGVIAYDRQDEVAIPNVCRLCRLTGAH